MRCLRRTISACFLLPCHTLPMRKYGIHLTPFGVPSLRAQDMSQDLLDGLGAWCPRSDDIVVCTYPKVGRVRSCLLARGGCIGDSPLSHSDRAMRTCPSAEQCGTTMTQKIFRLALGMVLQGEDAGNLNNSGVVPCSGGKCCLKWNGAPSNDRAAPLTALLVLSRVLLQRSTILCRFRRGWSRWVPPRLTPYHRRVASSSRMFGCELRLRSCDSGFFLSPVVVLACSPESAFAS